MNITEHFHDPEEQGFIWRGSAVISVQTSSKDGGYLG